jgi:hypothetical protein
MRGPQGDAARARGVPLSARSSTGERRIPPWAAAGAGILVAAALVAAALVGLASCAASEPSVTAPAPSGSLGVVTVEDARSAVSALCEIAAHEGTDRDAANAAFYDRAHQTLHVIAAAVEVRDRAAAAALQQDKGIVEEDLARERLPRSFADDVMVLVSGTRDALARVGIDLPPCPS